MLPRSILLRGGGIGIGRPSSSVRRRVAPANATFRGRSPGAAVAAANDGDGRLFFGGRRRPTPAAASIGDARSDALRGFSSFPLEDSSSAETAFPWMENAADEPPSPPPSTFGLAPPPTAAVTMSTPSLAHDFIRRWMTSNPQIAPYKAEELLAKMWFQQLSDRQPDEAGGNVRTTGQYADAGQEGASQPSVTVDLVNLVIEAWASSSNGEKGARRAERLLRWIEDLTDEERTGGGGGAFFDAANVPLVPNYWSYALVVEAWSRAARRESEWTGGATKDEAIRTAFACAKRAEDVMTDMEATAQRRRESGDSEEDFHPDTEVFHSILRGWSRIRGTKASATRAMRILDLMQELHHYGGRGGAGAFVKPTGETYKLVMRAFADCSAPEGSQKSEEILRHLLSMSKAGNVGTDVTPDAECFHIVMKSHAHAAKRGGGGDKAGGWGGGAECARKATALLEWMELLGNRVGVGDSSLSLRPTAESYRCALTAWAWSRDIDAPFEVEKVLFRMIRRSRDDDGPSADAVRPETRDFNTVISCCAFARGVGAGSSSGVGNEQERTEREEKMRVLREDIYKISEGVLEALLDERERSSTTSPSCDDATLLPTGPDTSTFANMIRACVNLLPDTDERDDRIKELFRLAYNYDCVDENVLRQLRHGLRSSNADDGAEEYIRVREEYEEFLRRQKTRP